MLVDINNGMNLKSTIFFMEIVEVANKRPPVSVTVSLETNSAWLEAKFFFPHRERHKFKHSYLLCSNLLFVFGICSHYSPSPFDTFSNWSVTTFINL